MPLRRYIFNSLTVVSLLLLLGVVGLWVDSCWQKTSIRFPGNHQFSSHYGQVECNSWGHQQSEWSIQRFEIIEPAFFTRLVNWNYAGFESGIYQTPSLSSTASASSPRSTYVSDYIAAPHWFLTLTFAILPTIWLYKWNKRRKLGPNACPSCGYDLTGNESGVCPECGDASETEAAV